MIDQFISEKFENQAVEIAKLSEQIESLDKKMSYKFDRLNLWFNEVEKNTTFRKKVSGGLKVFVVIMPIIAVIIILV